MYVRGNVLMTENAVVGDDFAVTLTTPPAATTLDSGNLKVGNNLFLNGGLYANVGGTWFGIHDYVKTLLPEFYFGCVSIPTPPTTGNTNATPIAITSKLPVVKTFNVQAGITALNLKDRTDLLTWWGPTNGIPGGSPLQVQIVPSLQKAGGAGEKYNLTFSYTVAPANVPPAGTDPIVAIDSIVVNYLVVLMP